jgi:hypothetical protein
MRPKEPEIAKLVRNVDGSMEIRFLEESSARVAVFTMADGAKLKVKQPRGRYQASRRVVEVSIRG